MNVAYICHHLRPNYEAQWFGALPIDKVVFITTDREATSDVAHVEYRFVRHRELGWENKFFASTARRVEYLDFEEHLKDIDVVVVLEVFSSLSRQFVEYCNRVGKKVVVLVYELIPSHPIYKIPSYRNNTRYCIKHADLFVSVSQAAEDHLISLGVEKSKSRVVYPGVDHDIFKPQAKLHDSMTISFVGKLEKHKGIDIMLETFVMLLNRYPDAKLKIAGGGSWESQVAQYEESYPDSIHYLGLVPNKELPALLNQSSIYVLPARETKRFGILIGAEQFGFSIVEAMACGLAVVTSNVGALPEVVTNINKVYDKEKPEGLLPILTSLLDDPFGTSATGAKNAKITRERYDLRKQAQQLADTFSSLFDDQEPS